MKDRTAFDYFGGMAESYDSLIRRAVPRYEEMLARLLDYLPPAASRILELGCGTGNLSLALAQRYPEAALTFIDAAPEMLAITRLHIAHAFPQSAQRARFVEMKFEEVSAALGSFDLVASSISLHHVRDKAALYHNLRAVLEAGGALCFSDQLGGGTPETHGVNWRRWLEFCREEENCTEKEIDSLLEHAAAHDHYTPLAEHFQLLAAAGFAHADCVWRNLIWGIITAQAAE